MHLEKGYTSGNEHFHRNSGTLIDQSSELIILYPVGERVLWKIIQWLITIFTSVFLYNYPPGNYTKIHNQ